MVFIQTAYFLGLELVQLWNERWEYFRDKRNIVEACQIVSNIILICLFVLGVEFKSKFFGFIMLCLTMYKLLMNLLVFESLGMLVLLILQCIKETIPFIIYLLIWIEFFVCLFQILGARVGSPIPGIEINFSNFVTMFRSSVGDL